MRERNGILSHAGFKISFQIRYSSTNRQPGYSDRFLRGSIAPRFGGHVFGTRRHLLEGLTNQVNFEESMDITIEQVIKYSL